VQNELLVWVLVIEDDQIIQRLVVQALSDGGFNSTIATTGEEALALLQNEKAKYRALVTDINLPGKLDGWEAARRVRKTNPEMPVVYMTGAVADQWKSHGVPNSILLVKPFAAAQLLTAISYVLNVGSPPTAPL
jgi:DNA-binding response OmpR family regulator